MLEEEAAAQANASGNAGSDDKEMKIPPKEVVEEVAEELGLHLVWQGPNVQCPSDWGPRGPQAPWPGGRGPLGFTPRFDAGAPARGPRKDPARGPFVGLYSHPTCQGWVHVPVSYPSYFTHLTQLIL